MKRSRKPRIVKKKIGLFVDIVGWYGVIAILLAYGLLSFGVMWPSSLVYQLLNFTGAFGILYEAWVKKDYEPVVLNIIWAVIALIGILRTFI